MKLRVVGSSPAWPNAGGACSGYLLDERVLLDCGPGVLAKLREREAWPSVEAIAITHLHLDHWGDLVPWVWACLFGPGAGEPRPELWLPRGSLEALQPILGRLGSETMLQRVFEVAEYDADEPFAAAGLELTARKVLHYTMDAYGFRAESNGSTLAYSGDSGPCEALTELAQDADLFLCEATLAAGGADGPPRGHLSEVEALAAKEEAGARRLLLTHRPDERDLDNGFELAHDGLVVDV